MGDEKFDVYDDEAEEDDHATIATGANVEEAKRNALAQLRKVLPGLSEAHIEYLVVEEGNKGGFLGRGRTMARVEARVRRADPGEASKPVGETADEESAEELRTFLLKAVELMGLTADVEITESPESLVAEISGDDLGLLIGRHGQTIDALQYLSSIVVNKQRHTRRQVVVDAEGYRERRTSSLHQLADRVAARVAREHTAVTLKPMTAAERKVIHIRLKDHPRVETASEGQEPHRAVVISPRR